MRTIDHARLAKQLSKKVLEIKDPIRAFFFRVGNLLPDYSYHTYCKSIGHGFSTARKKLVQAWQSRHFNGEGAVFYYRLGVAAHYLCDAFTYPHNKQFDGDLYKHISYENDMHHAFEKENMLEKYPAAPIFESYEKCMRYLEKAHREYLRSSSKSPARDIPHIISACRCALLTSLKVPIECKVNVKSIL